MTVSDTKTCVFAGAGFSAPFGHPTMDNFLRFTDSSPRLSEEDKLFLGRLVLEARRANSFLESSPTNLEDILTFSEMADRLGLVKQQESRGLEFRKIIQKIYTTPVPAEKYWEQYKPLGRLLGVGPKEWRAGISFVTTNYDLNIESACLSFGKKTNPGFNLLPQTSLGLNPIDFLYGESGVPLFKLHGSVNWFPCSQDPQITIENRVVQVHRGPNDNGKLFLPLPCASNYQPPDNPLIIPPSFLKPDLSTTMQTVWSGAAKALSLANVVIFIGYSFPTSDTAMMYLLARAFSENAGLRKIYVIDPEAEKLVARMRTPESKVGSHFRKLLIPISQDWTNVGRIE